MKSIVNFYSIKFTLLSLLFSITTVIIVGTTLMAIYSLVSTGNTIRRLSSDTVKTQAEQFLLQLVKSTAEKNDLLFGRISAQATNVAFLAQSFYESPEHFTSHYWMFDDHMFRASKGQYINSKDDVSSVFIPSNVSITRDIKTRMELTAHLDHIFPSVLANEPNAVAIWIVGPDGDSRYFPNIEFGTVVPPDMKVTEESFFALANPANNPTKKTVWIPVYDDPAGQGLMITASHPIYTKNQGFMGVLGIDVTLSTIIKNIEQYSPVAKSYSFLIDKNGNSVAMPDQAYQDLLGRKRKEKETRTYLTQVSLALKPTITEMMAGKSNFHVVTIGKKELYLAFYPLPSSGFSLGIVIERDSMLATIRQMTKAGNDSTRTMIVFRILPFGLMTITIVWILGVFYINRLIAPIQKLTCTARELSTGNLAVRSDITSTNEIGHLAASFNDMAEKLEESYRILEKKVAERTRELEETKKKLETVNVDLDSKVKVRTADLEALKNSLEKQVTDRTKIMNDSLMELKKIKDEAQIMLDAVPAWIFYKDRDNRFHKVNRALADAMGKTVLEMNGVSAYDLYPKEQADAFGKDDREIIDSGVPKRNIVEPVTTAKGLKYVQTDKIPHRDTNGTIIGIIGFSIDVTAQKIAEDDLLKRAGELERMNKLMVGRELRMVEMKKEIDTLIKQIENKT